MVERIENNDRTGFYDVINASTATFWQERKKVCVRERESIVRVMEGES